MKVKIHHRHSSCRLSVAVACLLSITLVESAQQATSATSSNLNVLKSISSQGIVVPKSPILIAGLNQQFKSRQPTQSDKNSTAPATLANQQKQPSQQQQPSKSLLATVGTQLVANLVDRRSTASASKKQQQPTSGLHVDRRQQEILAANPHSPLVGGNSNSLKTRSDVQPSDQLDGFNQQQPRGSLPSSTAGQQVAPNNNNNNNNNNLTNDGKQLQQQQGQADGANGPQQLYRGYSLIELEVRSDADRKFVQQLYGNLSAALNEQAQRPNANTVSPYVDIDFWSFKCALNDQIDIMVSPKSRAFVQAQLNRNRIKNRVKIEDIQARLDAQSLPPAPANGNQNLELSGRQSSSTAGPQQQQPSLIGRHQQHAAGASPDSSSSSSSLPSSVDGRAGSSLVMNDTMFFDNYQRLAEINEYLESLVARARDIARVQVIGRSSQGRYLRVLRLGYEQRDVDGSTSDAHIDPNDPAAPATAAAAAAASTGNSQAPPPAANNASRIVEQFLRRHQNVRKLGSIWLDGGTHAREWISPATVLYMSFRLADNHARCVKFFDYMQMVANQASQQSSQSITGQFASARSAPLPPPPSSANLDADLLDGINEINSSLLGGIAQKPRQRTEFEQKLELLSKRPQEVASEHNCDLDLERLLRRYTFYIMPVLNPDGYEYSHTHNRLWRKTRSTSNHPIYRHFCLGADPNRNYDARHGSTGSSSHPCSQTYGGVTPFTEPETRHQSNFVYAHRNDMKMFISFHSYSQMILLPYSHSKQLAPDHKDLESVGQAGVRAIERTHGTQYRVGASASILYTASGTASDWAYEKAGVKYSYTIELRDTGAYGFLLPRQQIVPTGEETFNGLLAMINQMEKNDNLLTPKSLATSNGTSSLAGANNGTFVDRQPNSGGGDLIHAPDLDQLRPFNRFRPRPAQLENAIDGSDSWATPQPPMLGVRDRRPLGQAAPGDEEFGRADSLAAHGVEEEFVSTPGEEPDAGYVFEGEGELMEPTHELEVAAAGEAESTSGQQQSKNHNSANHMNKKNSLLARQRAEMAQLYGHIHAHSSSSGGGDEDDDHHEVDSSSLSGRRRAAIVGGGQIQQQPQQKLPAAMVLSQNGRNLINSPPLPSRTTPGLQRRESSENQKYDSD